MFKFIKITAAAICCSLLLCGCENSDTPSELTVTEISVSENNAFPAVSCGEQLDKAVEKVVSLSPASTEIICELGFKDRLAAVSDYCVYPENLNLPKVGSTENPDLEKIKELAPDAVFATSLLSGRDKYTLNHSGIKVLVCDVPRNLEEYSTMYKEFASAFYGNEKSGSEKDESKAVEIGKNARLSLEKAAGNTNYGSFVYVTRKLTFAGNNTFENAVLSLCGNNLCSDEGYVEAYSVGSPNCIIADNALSDKDLAAVGVISEMIDAGAKVIFIDAQRFEKPTARTAEIF